MGTRMLLYLFSRWFDALYMSTPKFRVYLIPSQMQFSLSEKPRAYGVFLN